MKSVFLFKGIFLTLALSATPLSWADVKVMVLDSPVDYQHSWISPYIDTTSMSRYNFTDTSNQYGNWKELTDFYLAAYRLTIRRTVLPRLLELLDVLSNSKSTPEAAKAAQEEIGQKVNSDPDWGAALRVIGTYLHGTHVAGLATHGLDASQVKLITAPVFSIRGFEPFMAGALGVFQTYSNPNASKNIDQITLAISEQKIKVVNMSFGSRWGNSVEKTMEPEIPLFVKNPDTVFVVAAGNSSVDLSNRKGSDGEIFPTSKVRNVLFVGALDETGALSDFSDYGVGVVNIAAPGTSIGSSVPGEKLMHMAGTSMASPIVANRVALVRLQHPELSAPEAIQYLIDHETVEDSRLTGQITGGRSLKMYSEVRDFDQMDRETIEELTEFLNENL